MNRFLFNILRPLWKKFHKHDWIYQAPIHYTYAKNAKCKCGLWLLTSGRIEDVIKNTIEWDIRRGRAFGLILRPTVLILDDFEGE